MDPIDLTAEELGLPRELVETVVSDFWKAIREYIHELHTIKLGILLPYFRIDLRPAKILGELKLINKKIREEEPSEKTKANWKEIYDYWVSILLNLPYSDVNTKHQRYKRMYHPDRATEVNERITGRLNNPENFILKD